MLSTLKKIFCTVFLISLISCNQKAKQKTKEKNTQNHTLLDSVKIAYGTWNNLWNKKDVAYNYEYKVPGNKADISLERYIFSDEISYGKYSRNQVNALPSLKGEVIQFFDGKQTTVTVDSLKIYNLPQIKGSEFLRRANYFWFVMPYKLTDKGTIKENLGAEIIDGVTYQKVKITYNAKITGKKLNDIYILYINNKTKLIDQFYFSVPFLGMQKPLIFAKYNYKMIQNQQIATKRIYFLPNKNGGYLDTPSITQNLLNIKFNNGFTKANIQN